MAASGRGRDLAAIDGSAACPSATGAPDVQRSERHSLLGAAIRRVLKAPEIRRVEAVEKGRTAEVRPFARDGQDCVRRSMVNTHHAVLWFQRGGPLLNGGRGPSGPAGGGPLLLLPSTTTFWFTTSGGGGAE